MFFDVIFENRFHVVFTITDLATPTPEHLRATVHLLSRDDLSQHILALAPARHDQQRTGLYATGSGRGFANRGHPPGMVTRTRGADTPL